jgi:hypothetical protein
MDGEVTRRRERICGWLGWRGPGRGDLPAAAGEVGLRDGRRQRGVRLG